MKIVIPGGSGHVGEVLAAEYHRRGDEVVVFSRTPRASPWKVTQWDGKSIGPWVKDLENTDVLINLTGRSVQCRYHEKNRREIMHSRIDSVRVLGKACQQLRNPPKVWMQASTATIYEHRYDKPNDELTGIIGGTEKNAPDTWKFSIDVATQWEKKFHELDLGSMRKVTLRSAMIMSPERKGVFDTLLNLVRFGLGGKAGDGRQYMSWIHYQDLIRAIDWLIEKKFDGIVNLASPNPIPNEQFMKILCHVYGAPFGLPAFEWMIEAGAFILRSESELILKSRRVVPGMLLKNGFKFEFPQWEEAAIHLYVEWRKQKETIK